MTGKSQHKGHGGIFVGRNGQEKVAFKGLRSLKAGMWLRAEPTLLRAPAKYSAFSGTFSRVAVSLG